MKYNQTELDRARKTLEGMEKVIPSDSGIKKMRDPMLLDTTINSLISYNYSKVQFLFGHSALLAMLEYFVSIEAYERCKDIMDYIKENTPDLPTTL